MTFRISLCASSIKLQLPLNVLWHKNIYHARRCCFIDCSETTTKFVRKKQSYLFFCHPGHFQFTNQQFIASQFCIIFIFCCCALRKKDGVKFIQFANTGKINWSLNHAAINVKTLLGLYLI